MSANIKRYAAYYLKLALLLAALYAASHFLPQMPSVLVGLVLALFSAVSALGLVYHAIIRKTERQYTLASGGWLARLNGGRIVCFIVAFVLSVVCVAGFLLESASWTMAEWLPALLAAAAFPLLFLLVNHGVKREYEEAFRLSRSLRISAAILFAVLCILYFVILQSQSGSAPSSAYEAFLQAKSPLAEATSPLISEAGIFLSLTNGLCAFAASKAAQLSASAYFIIKILLTASTFLALANLVSVCLLPLEEAIKVFFPLQKPSDQRPQERHRSQLKPLISSMICAVLLPLLICAGFTVADIKAGEQIESSEISWAQAFVQDKIGIAVYVLDGKYYDQQQVEGLISEATQKSAQLAAQAQAELVPLINASFNKRLANVDAYLDWYYSLPADYERLIKLVSGDVSDFVQGQFQAQIEAGVDDSALMAALDSYAQQAADLESELRAQLASYEISGVPDWLVQKSESLSLDFMDKPLEPLNVLLAARTRLGLSAGAGVIAGILGKRLVEKAVLKPFFSKAVARIGSALAVRGGSSAVGAGIGSVVGPLGSIIGLGVGAAVGVGVDYLSLKIDEEQNRDDYRAQIVELIEEQRQETLGLVGA